MGGHERQDAASHAPRVEELQRVNVIGSSGAGKTTFAKRVATAMAAPYVELDALHHQPDWGVPDLDDFRADVASAVAGPRWVVDGNYSKVRDLVWDRADTVVFLDLPRWQVMAALARRTFRRTTTREVLWNGNREPWSNLWSLQPERNILVWSWTRHGLQRQRFEAAERDPQWSHIRFVRLRSRRAVADVVAAVETGRR